MKKDTKRIHIKIKGNNHGQESQRFAVNEAKRLGLTGYAQYEAGMVMIVAEGDKKNVWELIKKFTNSNFKAKVEEILFYFGDPQNEFENFVLV